MFIVLFADISRQHRPTNDRREQVTITTSGALSPVVSPCLGGVCVPQDGGVGVSLFITVMYIQQMKYF